MPLPTRTRTAPPLPPVEAPDPRSSAPLFPSADEPELNASRPLEPTTPPFADRSEIPPLLDAVPSLRL